MKIRFSKNDVFDTKGESTEVDQLANAPIYTAELTAEEVGYIKMFVETVSNFQNGISGGEHLAMKVDAPESADKCLVIYGEVNED